MTKIEARLLAREAKKHIEKLKKLINRHRYLYHVLDKEEISDEAFDTLKHELSVLESKFPDLITPDSPTQRVGGIALEKFSKVEHASPMLSIEDVFEIEELEDWETYLRKLSGAGKLEYFCELKIDGFAVALRYRNGILDLAATRGNGQVGENVTQNIKTIESIPLRLEIRGEVVKSLRNTVERLISNGEIEVRGEVYMEKKAFEAFNRERVKEGEEPYANPRNLAAGSIRQLDPSLASSRPLKFIGYGMSTEFGQKIHSKEHEMLSALGFKIDRSATICKNIQEVGDYWKRIEKKRDSLPFLVDGVVVSVNNNTIFQELGVAGKSPRGIRAFKFSGKQATTKIVNIQLQIGRTGAVTPVAILEPVQVQGVTISRATLHNEDEIERLDVRIGDTIIVERAGDVIPAVVRVLPELRAGIEKKFRMPKKCPVCETNLIRSSGEAVHRCPNKECRAQKREFLTHFVSKKAFDIEGLGPKIIDTLSEEHLLSDAADIFQLREGDIVPLERFAEKSAANIVSAVEKSKIISLSRFIYALGIRHVGEETAIDLAKNFRTIQLLEKATKEELEEIRDVGRVVAKSISVWFQSKKNQKFIDDLLKAGIQIQNPSWAKSGLAQAFHGKTFVLTGQLEILSRDEAKARIRELGGQISESVSKKTSYLVLGKNPGTKLNMAKKLNIKTIVEKEFLKLIQS